MKILKSQTLTVHDCRKGIFVGVALKDFDTDVEEFYPIAVHQDKPVKGINNTWFKGDKIPCRNSLCRIVIKDTKND